MSALPPPAPDQPDRWSPPPPPPGLAPVPASPGALDPSLTPFGQYYAGWWLRAVAWLIDSIVVGVVVIVLNWSLGLDPLGTTATVVSFGAFVAYSALLDGGPNGQTLGRRLVGIQVRKASTGGSLGPGPAAVRASVEQICYFFFLIPAILDNLWPLWDKRKQTWHDKVADSVVVRVEPKPPAAF